MAFSMCIPPAVGVPFLPGPPNWLQGTSGVNTTLDDPRWSGATEQALNFDSGGSEANFQALYHQESPTQTNLYLSWRVTLDMDGADSNADTLYVGFIPDPAHGGSNGPAVVFTLTLTNVQATDTGDDLAQSSLKFGTFVATRAVTSGATWSPNGSVVGTWLNDSRLWLGGAGSAIPWAFQLKVPIGVPIAQDTQGNQTIIGTSFRMWYSLAVQTPANGPLAPAKQLTWPNDSLNSSNDYDVTGLGVLPNFDDPISPGHPGHPWGPVTLAGLPGNPACAQGVSIGNFGTLNPLGPDRISLVNPNVFFADVTNNSGVLIKQGDVSARFRLADWGSHWQGATWKDIPVGHNVPSNQAIPALPALPLGHPILSQPWTVTQADLTQYEQNPNDPTPNSHQCALVQLSSTSNIQFDVDSATMNMNFGDTSVISENAEISVDGLPKTAAGHRDVYLYVERSNFPTTINYDPCAFGDDSPPSSLEAMRLELSRRASEGNLSLTDAPTAGLPTYRIHVYHDTGQKINLGGKEHPILHPQPGFGYYLLHDGRLFGWNHRIEGAELITPNFYRIPAIPDGKATKVRVTVEALEQPRGAKDSGFMVQSTVGNNGDFVLVVPDSKAGLSECTRRNDFSPTFPWQGPTIFGTEIGHVDAVSLIQSNYGLIGDLELVARVGEPLVHFWRDVSPGSTWNGPTTIVERGVSGNPALIQGRFNIRGNFELVVPLASGGIAHYWRDNDDPRPSWQLGAVFGKELGHVDAVALIQSNIGQPLPGHLEVIARVGDHLIHFWRDSGPDFKWRDNGTFFSGATGIPGFIQGNFGGVGHFELVTPVTGGGMVHLQRNNDEPATFPWHVVTSFGSGNVTAVSLLQSNFTASTTPNVRGPGDFEVAARVDGRTAHYQRQDEAPFTWTGPTAYACS